MANEETSRHEEKYPQQPPSSLKTFTITKSSEEDFDAAGIRFGMLDDALCVVDMAKDGLFAKQTELCIGSTVVDIDGCDCKDMTPGEALQLVQDAVERVSITTPYIKFCGKDIDRKRMRSEILLGSTNDGTVIVSDIKNDCIFATAGMTVGMKILRVNGEPCMPLDPCLDLGDLLCSQDNETTSPHLTIQAEPVIRAKPFSLLAPTHGDPKTEVFFAQAIHKTRAILQSNRSQGYGVFQKFKFTVFEPDWLVQCPHDLIHLIYRDQHMLRDKGQVVWACIVECNTLLFDDQNHFACPARVIYSPDPYYDANLTELRQIADCMLQIKGGNYEDDDICRVARVISNESVSVMKEPVPEVVTGGRKVYVSTVVVHRKHLPVNYLRETFFPLLVLPDHSTATMILPSDYWSNDLYSVWCRGHYP